MRDVPCSVIKAVSRTANPSAYLLLVKAVIGVSTVRLVDNGEDIIYQGDIYTAANISLGAAKEDSDGSLSSWAISIVDVTRLLASVLEANDGGVGGTVTLTIVNSRLLAEDYTELTRTFVIQATQQSGDTITVTLAGANLLIQRCPRHRYLALHCNWTFKSVECGYTVPLTACNRTYAQCVLRSNQARFGGFLALRSGAIRFA